MKRVKQSSKAKDSGSNNKKLKSSDNGNAEKEVVNETDQSKFGFNHQDGESVLKWILGDDVFNGFFENYWEKKPIVIRRSTDNEWKNSIQGLFSYEQMKKLIKEKKPKYELDINLCKLVNDKKKVFNKKGQAKLEDVVKAFDKDKVTIQFHQPQRYSDELWYLMEKLECYFNCLVGSNIYITPSESQGLAPHHDDIEAFVIQLEGSKHWLLYEPIMELPNVYSKDLNLSEIGKPTHDLVLEAGDVLYFPRGIIHQANTPKNDTNTHSTHITISTYQNFNKMEYINSVITDAISASFNNNFELRKGLPLKFFKSNNFSEILKSTLSNLKFNEDACYPTELLQDFVYSRLPPLTKNALGDGLSNLGLIQKDDKNLKFRLKYPDHVYAIRNEFVQDEENESDEENSEDEKDINEDENNDNKQKYVYIYNSVSNRREFHMMSQMPQSSHGIRIEVSCYDAMQYLINNKNNEWITTEKLLEKFKIQADTLKSLLVSLTVENLLEFSA